MSHLLFQWCLSFSELMHYIHNRNTGLMYTHRVFAMLNAIALQTANEDNQEKINAAFGMQL